MFKSKSIRSRLSLIVGVGMFVTIASLIIYTSNSTRKIAIQHTKDKTASQANESAFYIKNRIELALNNSRSMAYMLTTVHDSNSPIALSRESLLQMTRDVLENYDELMGVWSYWAPNAFDGKDEQYKNKLFSNADGRTYTYHAKDLNNVILPQQCYPTSENDTSEWYVAPIKAKQEHITEPYIYPINGVDYLLITTEAPIYKDTTFLGLVGCDISISWLQKFITEANQYEGQAEISIYSPSGLVAAHTSHENWLGKNIKECQPDRSDLILESIRKGKREIYVTNDSLFINTPIQFGRIPAHWQMRIQLPMSLVTAAANTMMWVQIIIAFLLFIACLAVVVFFLTRLMKPIHKTVEILDRVSKGDLPGIVNEKYVGEFDSIRKSVNEVVIANREIIEKTKRFSRGEMNLEFKKRSENDELMQAFTTMINTNRQIVNVARRVAQGDLTATMDKRSENDELIKVLTDMVKSISNMIEKVSNTAENVSVASKQLNATAQQVSVGASEQAASAEEVSASIEEISESISQNAENSKEAEVIAQKVTNCITIVAKAVINTNEAMKNIAQKIALINDIAKKTDLLAINAAIEASHSGGAGKGFSVVAGEIRKLAEHSAKAAFQIEEVSQLSLKQAESANELLTQISPDIEKTSALVMEITAASIEQSSGTSQMNLALQQLSKVIQQNSIVSEEMASNSEELSEQAALLLDAISIFKTTKQMQAKNEIRDLEKFVNEMQRKIAILKQSDTGNKHENIDISYDTDFFGGIEISMED